VQTVVAKKEAVHRFAEATVPILLATVAMAAAAAMAAAPEAIAVATAAAMAAAMAAMAAATGPRRKRAANPQNEAYAAA
jgi:hypothetical protein